MEGDVKVYVVKSLRHSFRGLTRVCPIGISGTAALGDFGRLTGQRNECAAEYIRKICGFDVVADLTVPEGEIRFAEKDNATLPEGRHTDWIWPFSLIPRRWNAIASDVPPVRIAGTEREKDHLDIPERGRWVIAGFKRWKVPVYFAVTTESGWHARVGLFRYTYPDPEGGGGYYTWPAVTVKRLGLRR